MNIYLNRYRIPDTFYLLYERFQGLEKFKMQDQEFYKKILSTPNIETCIVSVQKENKDSNTILLQDYSYNVDNTCFEPEKTKSDIAEDGCFTKKICKKVYEGGSMLVIPEGYTEIRPGACVALDDVTEVVLPSTLKKICSGAFSECSSIVSLDIPASVTVLEEDAFEDCTSLRMVAIPSHLESQARAAFPAADLMILD